MTRAWSPRGADRFYNLVKYHFFDGAAFFRVIQGFVVQFGISARPDVSRVWENAKIADDPVTQSNTRGMLTFATAGPNTRTTQVFINLGDNPNLDSMGFSPFGKVTSGMEVIDKLYSEYGEGPPDGNGPDQNRIQKRGKAYLEKVFSLARHDQDRSDRAARASCDEQTGSRSDGPSLQRSDRFPGARFTDVTSQLWVSGELTPCIVIPGTMPKSSEEQENS